MCYGANSAQVTISCAVDSDQTSSPQPSELCGFTSMLQCCSELDGLLAKDSKITTPVLSRSAHKARLQARLLRTKLRFARQVTTVRAQCHSKLKERTAEVRGAYRKRLHNAHVLLQLRIRQSRGHLVTNWRDSIQKRAIPLLDLTNIDAPGCDSVNELTTSETASEAAIDANAVSVTQKGASVTQGALLSPKRKKLRNAISELIKFHSKHSPRSISAV